MDMKTVTSREDGHKNKRQNRLSIEKGLNSQLEFGNSYFLSLNENNKSERNTEIDT